MKISCNILKKHIENSENIDFIKIWDVFTIRTAEVEGIEIKGEGYSKVVVGEILECKVHPTKEKYHVLKVDTGEEIVDILCGAPNVRKNLKVAIVKSGGTIAGMTIEPKTIAGVLSNGMLCSGRELGINDNHDGIIELSDDCIVGRSIFDYLPMKDIIVEIDNKSLTNRPDLWGHYGIAREIAAITNHKLKPLETIEIINQEQPLSIKINNSELCYRYTGVRISNVKEKNAPIWMQIALYYVGMRSISLLVDLTNYLMIELGQPMHAFNADKVKSIEVGLANKGDKFTTLDNVVRTLNEENLMIKKNSEYFAIAGVMGGLDSEITETTTEFILESATFNAYSVRKTAMSLGLRTDASARYEKSLDPELTILAIKRFVYLLANIDKGIMITSKITDVYPKPYKKSIITLNKSEIEKCIGSNLADDYVKNTLESLEFKVAPYKNYYKVSVPSFRATKDVTIEADLIEELARLYGYENIKKEPLKQNMEFKKNENKTFKDYYKVKRYLATKFNYHEVHSYLWYKTQFLNKMIINKDNIKVISRTEDNILRDDLSLSLLELAGTNIKNYDQFGLFEIGTVFNNNNCSENLSIVLADKIDNLEKQYNQIKLVITDLLKTIKNKDVEFYSDKTFEYYNMNLTAKILINEEMIGFIKVFDISYSSKLLKNKCVVCAEIFMNVFENIEKDNVLYNDISVYPSVKLDYTIKADVNEKYINIKDALNEFKSPIINNVELVYVYNSEQEKRYTIRYTLLSNDKTLEQNEINDFKEEFTRFLKNNKLEIVE